ncbi:MAG TPA: hypothetical protein VE621_02420 [Bryobacteraceae bacterium]|jgi:cell division protein FtsL|nr:hypothetical protein [Bryobacteraceae bacterium]
MATLANIFGRFGNSAVVEPEVEDNRNEYIGDLYRLRPLPNEDVYFFIKRIDNSRVIREADPRARASSWKFLGGACVAAALLIGTLLPTAYGLLASHQLHALQVENQRLLTEQATLQLEEARLLSPERLEELAKMQKFVDPTPEKVVYLPAKDASFARSRY